MPAPSKTFTVIADTDVDPDSPITTGLMTAFRDNDIHLEEWLGMDYTAAQNHDHNGTNSKIITATGETIIPTHMFEIHDHFSEAAFDTTMWTVTGTPACNVNGHYADFGSGEAIDSKFSWRIDQIKVIFEARAKATPTTTAWPFTELGIQSSGGARQAIFDNPSVADQTRCRTIGSGGTQDTNVAIPGNGVDDWHIYRIDQTSQTQTVFSIDGTVVATHTTRVPDGQDLTVRIGGSSNLPKVDYVRAWATANPLSTS